MDTKPTRIDVKVNTLKAAIVEARERARREHQESIARYMALLEDWRMVTSGKLRDISDLIMKGTVTTIHNRRSRRGDNGVDLYELEDAPQAPADFDPSPWDRTIRILETAKNPTITISINSDLARYL